MFVVVISQLHLQNHFSMASNSEPKLIFCQKLTNCELCHISKMAPHKWMTFLNFDTYSNFFLSDEKTPSSQNCHQFLKNLLTQGSNPKKIILNYAHIIKTKKVLSWISFSFQIKRSHNGVKSLLLYSEIDIPLGWSVCVTNCSNTQRLALPSDRALEQTQQKNIALAEDSTNVFLNLKKALKNISLL